MIAQDSDNPYQDAIDSINTRNSSQKNCALDLAHLKPKTLCTESWT